MGDDQWLDPDTAPFDEYLAVKLDGGVTAKGIRCEGPNGEDCGWMVEVHPWRLGDIQNYGDVIGWKRPGPLSNPREEK